MRKTSTAKASGTVRLQKYLADAGVAARRVCEELIESGRVEVNSVTVSTLPAFVEPGVDRVRVDGREVRGADRKLYVMLHKPTRVLSTTADEPGSDRATVLDLVQHPSGARLFPVGRLDYDATGLVLLTNDGELANRLSHPRFGVEKTYLVTVKGRPDEKALANLSQPYKEIARRAAKVQRDLRGPKRDATPIVVRVPRGMPQIRIVSAGKMAAAGEGAGANSILEIRLQESHGGQLQDVLRMLGTPVRKIIRVAIGGLQLKGLASGQWRELSREEIQVLRKGGPAKPSPSVRKIGVKSSMAPDQDKNRKPLGERSHPSKPKERSGKPASRTSDRSSVTRSARSGTQDGRPNGRTSGSPRVTRPGGHRKG
ncbi:MAG: rRNA pseudouridine synthase [Phycisphaerales bacterium]|nr:MAG: rRNA pseudouridine synthase [Phycisphaerales bacterium]